MKKIFYILTAALLLTGCTVDDTAIDNNAAKTVTFTATLAPKGGATTRAITANDQGTANETLTTTWAVGEQIEIKYQFSATGMGLTTATVTDVNKTTGAATITATLDSPPKDGGDIHFLYPATMAPSSLAYTFFGMNNLFTQYGNLTGTNSISTLYDVATYSGTINNVGATTGINGTITMENEVCICKFHFALDEGTGMGMGGGEHTFRTVTIDDGDGHIYTITSDRPDDQIGGATRGFKSTDDIYVAMLPIENKTVTFSYTETQSSGEVTYRSFKLNVTLEKGKFYRNLGTITMVKQNPVTLTSSTGELILQDNDMLSGTGGANTRLKIAAGATVTLNGVTNTGITGTASIPGIECLGDATIILNGDNSVRGREYAPGIFVPEGKTLTIKGSGTLVATGGNTSSTAPGFATIGGAGIGGTKDVSCGSIVIASGTITATGTGWCAGIGSGDADQANTTCGNITISGGTVTATGGRYAAGIGSGDAELASNTSGDITISGGTVTATGGVYAAGIGSGNGNYNQGNHYVSACGAISITGGTVTATSGERAAGIGSGNDGSFASISIGSGIIRVTATRSNDYFNVPIGKGNDDQGSGAVTFGSVTMHDGRKDYMDPSEWTNWPTDGQTYGGIRVAVTNDPFTNRTWTLTKAPTQ